MESERKDASILYIIIGLSRCVAMGRGLRGRTDWGAGTSKAWQTSGRADGPNRAKITRISKFETWRVPLGKNTWGPIYKISYDKLRIKCDLGKS